MASENAKLVAQEVIKAVSKGKLINKQKISQKVGYSYKSARAQKAVRTDTYKLEIKPFLEKLTDHRERVIKAMDKKNLNKEQYKILSDALAKITHDIQLLSGGKTDREEVIMKWK